MPTQERAMELWRHACEFGAAETIGFCVVVARYNDDSAFVAISFDSDEGRDAAAALAVAVGLHRDPDGITRIEGLTQLTWNLTADEYKELA